MNNVDELKVISDILQDPEVLSLGMDSEIMWSAIKFAQKNPNASVQECMDYGFNEWIK